MRTGRLIKPLKAVVAALAAVIIATGSASAVDAPALLYDIDPLSDKVVALTFDDGPHKANTDKLLKVLEDNGVVATFFMVGENIERYPEVVRRVSGAGHEIGLHSYDHSNLTKLSVEDAKYGQVGRANDALYEAIGRYAELDRPPYGSMSKKLASSIGRTQILWDVDPEDWKAANKSTERLLELVLCGVRDGSIILSHDIHATTVDAYDAIIRALKDEGYKFVTVSQMIEIAKARGAEIGYTFSGAPKAKR